MLSDDGVFQESPEEAEEEERWSIRMLKKIQYNTLAQVWNSYSCACRPKPLKVQTKKSLQCVFHPPRSCQVPQKALVTQNMCLLMISVMITIMILAIVRHHQKFKCYLCCFSKKKNKKKTVSLISTFQWGFRWCTPCCSVWLGKAITAARYE